MLRSFFITIGVIEYKLMILYVLCNPIYFNFRFVHLNSRIEAANCIYFTSLSLFFEERAFANTNTNIHWGRANMIESAPNLVPLFTYHQVEVIVTNFTRCCGHLLSFLLLFLKLFVLLTSLCSLLLHLFNVVDNGGRFSWYVSSGLLLQITHLN